ncbi:MAG: hypothetical protein IPL40_14300 [Proteobacteria bacterium]|nr:hypothetical protein [Pseudomonadota bacterium]
MSPTRTKRALSPARQQLVVLMQEVNFGRIEGLPVIEGEPVLEPPPRVLRDFLLGKTNAPHAARSRDDFALKEQVIELFDLFDRERSVTVESLVVQNGLPVRMTVADGARVT